MGEYILDMGNSSYQSTSGLLCADVSQLREEIVRCKDCRHFKAGEEQPPVDWCYYFHDEVTPLGFCAWGNRVEFVTCKCGEELERFGRVQTCPSCGRRLMA